VTSFAPRFCVTGGGHGGWETFAADVAMMRTHLRGARAVCNLAPSRYGFAVGLAAAMIEGVTTILPPSRADRAVAGSIGDEAGVVMLGPGPKTITHLPRLPELAGDNDEADPQALRRDLAAATGEVRVFTSGSTGAPVPHVKSWVTLLGGGRLAGELAGRAGLGNTRFAILGTTPHQHMYGLEATIFSVFSHGNAILDVPAFYPADLERAATIAAAAGIEAIVLVTSPAHLRFLEPAVLSQPLVRAVISATAPLPSALAERIEAAGVPVLEIYGSTESGSTAWRRTALDPLWTLAGDFTLTEGPWGHVATAPHLPGPVLLADELGVQPDGRFRLIGRRGDMINIAGKRQSLGALNAVLPEAPGVADAVMLVERHAEDDELTALVVADAAAGLDGRALRSSVRAHMNAHFDPVFLPRRIVLVERLPRSETGKISDAETRELVRRHAAGG